jgi:hypothetical protein
MLRCETRGGSIYYNKNKKGLYEGIFDAKVAEVCLAGKGLNKNKNK